MNLKRNIFSAIMVLGLTVGFSVAFAQSTNPPPLRMPESAGVKPYPLKTCIVSGDKIGEMAKPVTIIYKNQQVTFCCKDCVKDFKKDPDKYVKAIAEEQAKEAAAAKK